VSRSRLIEGTEVIQETYGKPRTTPTEERCLPDRPPVGHHDIITDLALCRTTQTLIVTSSRDGMVKVWKWPPLTQRSTADCDMLACSVVKQLISDLQATPFGRKCLASCLQATTSTLARSLIVLDDLVGVALFIFVKTC